MGWDIRRSYDGYETAFEWYQKAPAFLKATWTPYLTEHYDEFVEAMKQGLNYSAYVDGQFTVMIHGQIVDPKTIEGHLFCAPHADEDVIVATVRYSMRDVLKQYEKIVCCVHRRHALLHDVMRNCNFVDTGLRAWKGVYRSAPVEVLYYLSGGSA